MLGYCRIKMAGRGTWGEVSSELGLGEGLESGLEE